METPYYTGVPISNRLPLDMISPVLPVRLAQQIHPTASADFELRIDHCSSYSVRVGVMQTTSQSACTGENWYSADNVGRVMYCGAGLFSGNYREKSRLSGAIGSGFIAGDVVGVHVRGHDVSFSKNGVSIPGKMRRSGHVYLGIQLCSPGDQITLLNRAR